MISLLLNVESSRNGLEGMKQVRLTLDFSFVVFRRYGHLEYYVKLFMTLMQVAKMLKLNKRIGLSTTEDGSYIYVCLR